MPDSSFDSTIIRQTRNTKMLNRLAVTISVLFSPFLLPIASILLIVRSSVVTMQQGLLWMVIVILFASVLPMLYIFYPFSSWATERCSFNCQRATCQTPDIFRL